MPGTQIETGPGEAAGIVGELGIPIILGFRGVWRASPNAHSKTLGAWIVLNQT